MHRGLRWGVLQYPNHCLRSLNSKLPCGPQIFLSAGSSTFWPLPVVRTFQLLPPSSLLIASFLRLQEEYYEREFDKFFVRRKPLGLDKDHNRYWYFPREPRLFVESKDSTAWGYYQAKEEVSLLAILLTIIWMLVVFLKEVTEMNVEE